jgi:hypothetical protein
MKKILLTISISLLSSISVAKSIAPIQLFGTTLQGATREQLRNVYKNSGLTAIRENDDYWVDKYNPNGVLEGATEFTTGYVNKTSKFAYAEYTFSSFMDSKQVLKVAKMVSSKYGAPNSAKGDIDLGEVSFRWNFPNGISINVDRGWPDTTTYLTIRDQSAYAQEQAEIKSSDVAETNRKSKAQSNAF